MEGDILLRYNFGDLLSLSELIGWSYDINMRAFQEVLNQCEMRVAGVEPLLRDRNAVHTTDTITEQTRSDESPCNTSKNQRFHWSVYIRSTL